MVDQNSDFFKVEDNFKENSQIPSISILTAKLDFVPHISIAITTNKRSDVFKEALDSAINQVGYSFYDILVVDDNPERNCETEKLINTYSDKRISYYKNTQSLKMVGNFNRCFELSKSPWIVLLHDDDLLLPDFISECVNAISLHPDIGVLKPLQYQWNESEKLDLPKIPDNKKLKRIYDVDNFFGFIIGPPTGILFNREKFFSLGGFNAKFYPQMDFGFMVLFSYYYKVFQMNRVLSIYRWGRNVTLRAETLRGFIINDYYLYSFLFNYFKIPKQLSKSILSVKFFDIEKKYQKVNTNFNFDIKNLGITPISQKAASFSIFLLRGIRIFYKITYFAFGNYIFKTRADKLSPCIRPVKHLL